MKNAENLVPAYCLHRPTGQAFLTVRRGGKRVVVYLGKWGSEESFSEYERELRKSSPSPVTSAVAEARTKSRNPSQQPALSNPSSCTVRNLWTAFFRWAPSDYRLPTGEPSRELGNFRDAVRELLDGFGDRRTNEFNKRDLETVRERMVAAGLSRGVVNKILRIFRWGTEESRGLVPETVVATLHLLKKLEPHRSAA